MVCGVDEWLVGGVWSWWCVKLVVCGVGGVYYNYGSVSL